MTKRSTRATVLALSGLLALQGCAKPMPTSGFAGTLPDFDPLTFFTGHVASWGVIEDRSGQPTGIVTTDCHGDIAADGSLHMRQRLVLGDGSVQTRDWHMRRTAPHLFEATANDMVGTAHGEAQGRAFHWRWTLATRHGGAGLYDVTMDQWMYSMDDGGVVNRTTIRKLGLILAEVTERFGRQP